MLFLLVSPLSIIFGEIYTRIMLNVNVDSKQDYYSTDSIVGFKFKPDSVGFQTGREYNVEYSINANGIRDRDYGPKPKGVYRILLLGDSFAVSHGLSIEHSLSRQIENALESLNSGEYGIDKFEVINAALGGYSPYNYLQAYDRWVDVFEVDMIIVALSPDDYDSSNAKAKYLIIDGSIHGKYFGDTKPPESEGFSILKLRKTLSWNSEMYVLLRNYLYYNDTVGSLKRLLDRRAPPRSNQFLQYQAPLADQFKKGWGQAFSYLRRLNNKAKQDGVDVVVTRIPLKAEIVPESLKEELLRHGLTKSEVNLKRVDMLVSEFCESEGIPFIEISSTMATAQREVSTYFEYDGHWNSVGVGVGASEIAERILNSGALGLD